MKRNASTRLRRKIFRIYETFMEVNPILMVTKSGMQLTRGFLLWWLQPARTYRSVRAGTYPSFGTCLRAGRYTIIFLSLSRRFGRDSPSNSSELKPPERTEVEY